VSEVKGVPHKTKVRATDSRRNLNKRKELQELLINKQRDSLARFFGAESKDLCEVHRLRERIIVVSPFVAGPCG
jgi:hypothetical protein